MPLTSRCPGCQKLLALPEGLVGSEVCCPSCKIVFIAGSTKAEKLAPPFLAYPSIPQFPTQPKLVPSKPETPDFRRDRLAPEWEDEDYDSNPKRSAGSLGGRGKALLAQILLSLEGLVAVACIYLNLRHTSLVQRMELGQFVGPEELAAWDFFAYATWVVQIFLTISLIIAVGLWIHKAHKNLVVLGVRGKRFSPAWAVGWFFVPLANYFKPCQAMFELWKASDPNFGLRSHPGWKQAPSSALIGIWWAFWILSNLTHYIGSRLFASENISYSQSKISMTINSVAHGLTFAAGLSLIFLIHGIQNRQQKKVAILNDLPEDFEYPENPEAKP